MQRVRDLHLMQALAEHLADKQAEIDGQADYAAKVARAHDLWAAKSVAMFERIRGLLIELCPGPQRCHYCEDSVGDEVEHVWPKALYPSRTFRWSNYLFSCGACNGSYKRDQFAVFDQNGAVMELQRRPDDPVVEPPAGDAVFIDPRIEDPFQFMELDLETGLFVPLGSPGDRVYRRAEFTIRVLGLNKRDYLKKSRSSAYVAYVDSALAYVRAKADGASARDLARRAAELGSRHHPTVWAEIKRLSDSVGLKEIFEAAPELLDV